MPGEYSGPDERDREIGGVGSGEQPGVNIGEMGPASSQLVAPEVSEAAGLVTPGAPVAEGLGIETARNTEETAENTKALLSEQAAAEERRRDDQEKAQRTLSEIQNGLK